VKFECRRCHTTWELNLLGRLARRDRELTLREQELRARQASLSLREQEHKKEVQLTWSPWPPRKARRLTSRNDRIDLRLRKISGTRKTKSRHKFSHMPFARRNFVAESQRTRDCGMRRESVLVRGFRRSI